MAFGMVSLAFFLRSVVVVQRSVGVRKSASQPTAHGSDAHPIQTYRATFEQLHLRMILSMIVNEFSYCVIRSKRPRITNCWMVCLLPAPRVQFSLAGTVDRTIWSCKICYFIDDYRVRSWRSDAINYYITYCQIADLKLLTENW